MLGDPFLKDKPLQTGKMVLGLFSFEEWKAFRHCRRLICKLTEVVVNCQSPTLWALFLPPKMYTCLLLHWAPDAHPSHFSLDTAKGKPLRLP